MTNSADPDQLASTEANWSGSTLFAKAEYIQVQQDKGSTHQEVDKVSTLLGEKEVDQNKHLIWTITT